MLCYLAQIDLGWSDFQPHRPNNHKLVSFGFLLSLFEGRQCGALELEFPAVPFPSNFFPTQEPACDKQIVGELSVHLLRYDDIHARELRYVGEQKQKA